MATPQPYDWFLEPDYALLVRGTTEDEIRANTQLAIDEAEDECEGHHFDADPADWRIAPDCDITPRWLRKNPCSPSNCWDGGIHGWHLGPGRPGQRGAFLGAVVELTTRTAAPA